jgi:type III secretory pathway component EscV
MTQPIVEDTLPALAITFNLGPALSEVSANPSAEAQLRRSTEQAVAVLLETLGIPGRPHVDMLAEPKTDMDNHTALFDLTVNGKPCRFSNDLVLQAYSYVNGTPLAPFERLHTLPNWLSEDLAASTPAPEDRASALLSLVCREALTHQAGLLLGPAQAERYRADLALADTTPVERLLPILRRVVDLRISIADRATVARVLSNEFASNHSAEEAAEHLIAALRPAAIEVRIEPAYLRQLTLENVAKGAEMFPFMRDGLFVELGITLPDFHFVPDATLKPGAFAFTINHLRTLPLIGLPLDTILVNDTAERLRLMNIAGTPTTNPATMQPGSLVERANKDMLEAAGLTTWDQMGYLILCCAAVLRRSGHVLVDRELADAMLKQLGRDFPELERLTRAYVALDALTVVLRALVAEELSIRNLRRILERLIEYEVCIDADRPGERVEFVRASLRNAIAHKYARGTKTLVVYLLDPEMEQALANYPTPEPTRRPPEGLGNALYVRLAGAVRNELRRLPPTAQLPVILTKDSLRAAVRATLAQEFPRLAVVSYADISPDQNIQPVARISWQ